MNLILKSSTPITLSIFIIFYKVVNFEFYILSIFFVLLIINLEFGIGLFGLSLPLMFNIHATFSGAPKINNQIYFFLNILKFY